MSDIEILIRPDTAKTRVLVHPETLTALDRLATTLRWHDQWTVTIRLGPDLTITAAPATTTTPTGDPE